MHPMACTSKQKVNTISFWSAQKGQARTWPELRIWSWACCEELINWSPVTLQRGCSVQRQKMAKSSRFCAWLQEGCWTSFSRKAGGAGKSIHAIYNYNYNSTDAGPLGLSMSDFCWVTKTAANTILKHISAVALTICRQIWKGRFGTKVSAVLESNTNVPFLGTSPNVFKIKIAASVCICVRGRTVLKN